MTTLDPADIVPLRILDARRRNWRDAAHVGAAESLVSLALNLAVLAGLVHLAFPQTRLAPEPHAILVDLVPEVPRPTRGTGGRDGQRLSGPTARQAAAAQAQSPAVAVTSPTSGVASPPSQPENPEPKLPPAQPEAATQVTRSEQMMEAPASIDAGHDATPHLVAAPIDPAQASTEADENQAANAEIKPADSSKPVETPPPPQPDILATPLPTAEAMPPPAATADQSKPAPLQTSEAKREEDNTAKLAAALPFAQSFAVDMHRAALSGNGAADGAKYRGAVYGAFHKADDLVEAAHAKHLRGQAVIEFSIDDGGNLTSARVAVPSGDPAVDETALAMIRQSAPYPPPPPGAQRTFSPAIRLGLDD